MALECMACSCAAGKALCNHMVALLFQTAHYSTLGFKTAIATVLHQHAADLAPAKDTGQIFIFTTLENVGLAVRIACIVIIINKNYYYCYRELHQRQQMI